MSSNTMARIEELIGEIQQLTREKYGVKDPGKKLLIQSEIFRKFAIVNSLRLEAESISIWTKKLRDWVSKARREARAKEGDFERMKIPRLEGFQKTERDGSGRRVKQWDHFPYMNLPAEMRAMILGNLTSARDKMNIFHVMPDDFIMMKKWGDPRSFEFELEFKRQLMEKKVKWKDVITWSNESVYKRDAIQRHFQNSLVDFSASFPPACFDAVYDEYLEKGVPQDWNPLPLKIHVRCVFPSQQRILSLLQFLDDLGGHRIFDFQLTMIGLSPQNTVDTIRAFIRRLPNVRRLDLFAFVGFNEEFGILPLPPQDFFQFSDALPHLKYLILEGLPTGLQNASDYIQAMLLQQEEARKRIWAVMMTKFLERYGPQLEGLLMIPILSTVLRGIPPLPTLSTFEGSLALGPLDKRNIERDCISHLDNLEGIPLKSLKIVEILPQNFPEVMIAIAHTFGGTLKKLDVRMEQGRDAQNSPPQKTWDIKAWKGKDFSKLKTLQMTNFHGNLNFLLGFPALENLHLRNCIITEERDKSANALPLSWRHLKREDEWRIWKILPRLQKILMTTWSGKSKRTLSVTRNQCIDAQLTPHSCLRGCCWD